MDRTDRALLKHGGSCWPTSLNGDSMIKHRDLIPAESQKFPEVVATELVAETFFPC